jgi:hypothetical protein
MTPTRQTPSPLFDGLQQMLADEDYQPKLMADWAEDYALHHNKTLL